MHDYKCARFFYLYLLITFLFLFCFCYISLCQPYLSFRWVAWSVVKGEKRGVINPGRINETAKLLSQTFNFLWNCSLSLRVANICSLSDCVDPLKPVGTLCTVRFNILKFYIPPSVLTYVCMDLRTNSDSFPLYLTDILYNLGTVCLLRGTIFTFIYASVLKYYLISKYILTRSFITPNNVTFDVFKYSVTPLAHVLASLTPYWGSSTPRFKTQ
jgi:hypothetical protein